MFFYAGDNEPLALFIDFGDDIGNALELDLVAGAEMFHLDLRGVTGKFLGEL